MAAGRSYNALVTEHFHRPRHTPCHRGEPDVVVGAAGSIEAGVVFRLSAKIKGPHIAELRFEAYGCPYSIAAASLLTQRAVGFSREDASNWSSRALAKEVDLPNEKRGRLLILEDALRDLLKAWPT